MATKVLAGIWDILFPRDTSCHLCHLVCDLQMELLFYFLFFSGKKKRKTKQNKRKQSKQATTAINKTTKPFTYHLYCTFEDKNNKFNCLQSKVKPER